MSLSNNFWLKGLIGQRGPNADGTETMGRFDHTNGLVVTNKSGLYAEDCSRGMVFSASAAAFTMPVNANNLASKFTLLNPLNSGIVLELIDADISTVVATTVVDAVGLYGMASPGLGTLTAAPTLNNLLGYPSGLGIFYSAATFTGTPTLAQLLGGWGAITDGGLNNVHYDFNGKVMVPPGAAVALAMTTAPSTASGITASMSWIERPL